MTSYLGIFPVASERLILVRAITQASLLRLLVLFLLSLALLYCWQGDGEVAIEVRDFLSRLVKSCNVQSSRARERCKRIGLATALLVVMSDEVLQESLVAKIHTELELSSSWFAISGSSSGDGFHFTTRVAPAGNAPPSKVTCARADPCRSVNKKT